MRHRTNRRDFLKQTALSGIGFWVAGGLAAGESKSPNDKLSFACIGVGGKGSSDTDHVGALGNVVALCDIDDHFLEAKAKYFPKAKKYHDYRKMLDELGKQIDAVTVSTPDHTHAPASIMAMKMGKHVYCQKPLAHTVQEARLMRDIAAGNKVATQMGNQGTAANGLRRAVEIIQAGVIGPVTEVHVWTDRPAGYWKQAPQIVARPQHADPVPKHIHWDLWLGTAPERPFVGNRTYHDFHWRGWWDFGTGALADMACHTANMAYMALKLELPTSISAESGEVNSETYPAWARIVYEFPARGDLPPVKLTWYEGAEDGQKLSPPGALTSGQKVPGSGSLLVGSKGILFSPNDYGARHVLLPEKEFVGHKDPEPTMARNGGGDLGQKREWVAAIKGGQAAMSNFDYASRLTETMILGNVAIRAGRKIEYDGHAGQVTNCPEAAQYLRQEYRKGWAF